MKSELKQGLKFRNEIIVDQTVSAKNVASGTVDVYATPMMIALMEQTAYQCVQPYLESGQATVGTKVEVSHISATPMGKRVYAEAELIEVDRRRLVFRVEAYDEAGKIGEGIHERFIIDIDRFMDKLKSKYEK